MHASLCYYSEIEGAVSHKTKSDDDSLTDTRRHERSRLLAVACVMSRSLVESQLVLVIVVRPQLKRKKRRPMVGNGDLLCIDRTLFQYVLYSL